MASTVAPPPVLPGMVSGIAKLTPQLPQLPNSVAAFITPPPPVLAKSGWPSRSASCHLPTFWGYGVSLPGAQLARFTAIKSTN